MAALGRPALMPRFSVAARAAHSLSPPSARCLAPRATRLLTARSQGSSRSSSWRETGGCSLSRPAQQGWQFPSLPAVAYLSGVALLAYLLIDEYVDLVPWRTVNMCVLSKALHAPITLDLRTRSRPPPIGCANWPAGRVLLQLLLDEEELEVFGDVPATVLEIGSGIGTTAIGLALAAQERGASVRVVATDVCEASLSNLHANAAAHQLDSPLLRVEAWDAAGGEAALSTCPVPVDEITHVVAADVIYSGGAAGVCDAETESQNGLAATLAALLSVRPDISVTLLLVDRFSGGTVSAIAMQAGVEHQSCTIDSALVAFRRQCAHVGLEVIRRPISDDVIHQVAKAQAPWTYVAWWFAGYWDGFQVCTIRPSTRMHQG